MSVTLTYLQSSPSYLPFDWTAFCSGFTVLLNTLMKYYGYSYKNDESTDDTESWYMFTVNIIATNQRRQEDIF